MLVLATQTSPTRPACAATKGDLRDYFA